METTRVAERLAVMTDPELTISERFAALDARREEYGYSIDRLSRAAGYKSSQTWYDLRDGKRPASTMTRFEKAFDWLIAKDPDDPLDWSPLAQDQPVAAASTQEGLMEIEVTGDFGVRVIVRAPVSNADELERAAAKIIRDIRGTQGSADLG